MAYSSVNHAVAADWGSVRSKTARLLAFTIHRDGANGGGSLRVVKRSGQVLSDRIRTLSIDLDAQAGQQRGNRREILMVESWIVAADVPVFKGRQIVS